MNGTTNKMQVTQYKCQKCKKELKDTVHLCKNCDIPYHPGCFRFHKIKNQKGEMTSCEAGFTVLDLKEKQINMEIDSLIEFDEREQIGLHEDGDQRIIDDNENRRKRKRATGEVAERADDERLCQLIQNSIEDVIHPLINKIDSLQNEIIESKAEIVDLKQIINTLVKQNHDLQMTSKENKIENNKVASVTYASIAQKEKKKKTEAVFIVKPIQVETDVQKSVNKNENLTSVKNNINIKELGVGVTSIKEKSNGTVIVKCKDVNDRNKLQKSVADKIGERYNVQVPKTVKKFVKIAWIDNDEMTLTDDEIINNIVLQNNLRDCCENVDMKIVKRIVNKNKNDFSVIIEVNTELQKMLLFMEKVCLGWKQCKVFEHVNIVRCFKCCGYNHYANECKKDIHCGKCGNTHSSKNCESTVLKCINCYNKNKEKNTKDNHNDKHNAYDKNCPIYIKLVENQKKRCNENI